MCVTFGWMDFMVIYKWLTDYYPDNTIDIPDSRQISKAPSVITLMISMILTPTSPPSPALFLDADKEKNISLAMLALAFICVPSMLLVKPFVLKSRMDNNHK